ncbi:MAG: DNA-directed RNA polymerase subunit omega [Atribacterota bacterium]
MEKSSFLDNKYLLTMMVAKRAKQLNQGSKVLVESEEKNNRLLALREIQQGKVYIKGDEKMQNVESDVEGK